MGFFAILKMAKKYTLGRNLWLYFSFCFLCESAMGSVLECDQRCGSIRIPYPFSITRPECGHRLFQNLLHCKSNSTLLLRIGSGEYTVSGISQKSIIVDPLASRSNCSKHNVAAFNFNFTNLAISYDNFLILYSCKDTTACKNNGLFNGSIAFQFNTKMCGTPGCCYDMRYADRPFLQSMNLSSSSCTTFTSWVQKSEITGEARYGLELEWAFPEKYCRDLKCQKNSQSRPGYVVDGCRCECLDGYEGDPYNSGCVRITACDKADRSCECENGRLPGSNGCKPSHSRIKTVALAIPISVFVTVVATAIGKLLWRRYQQQKLSLRYGVRKEFAKHSIQPTFFSYDAIKLATSDFHPKNKLGEGAFGEVYRGVLSDNTTVAVKRLHPSRLQQQLEEFVNEVTIITKVVHRNLIKIIGYCIQDTERVLVYEFAENNSLSHVLFGPEAIMLDWDCRVNIALGTAHGLAYLHEGCSPRIIHRDIKTCNILLDKKMQPKIADFGLARLVPEDASHVSTRVAGTYGYVAPEYGLYGQLTEKADVYSYGVVTLELITGRKCLDLNETFPLLLNRAWEYHEAGRDLELVDARFVNEVDERAFSRLLHVAFLCTQEDPRSRPSMSNVVSILLGETAPIDLKACQPRCRQRGAVHLLAPDYMHLLAPDYMI